MNIWVVKTIPGGNPLIKLNPLQSLSRISPSRFFGFSQCKLREVLAASGSDGFLPLPPQAYFGRAAHKLLEKASKGIVSSPDRLEEEWNTCIAEVEQTLANNHLTQYLVPLSANVQRYEVKKRLLLKTAASLIPPLAKSGSDQHCNGGSELWLESSDQVVGGFVDKIVRTLSGYEILDYKTGQVMDKNGVKPEYSVQLKLYAAAFFERSNEWPTALKIIDKNGFVYNIAYDPEESSQLLIEARKLLQEVNGIIETTDSISQQVLLLATPSPENCRFCRFRPACGPYWQQKSKTADLHWPIDVLGTVVDITMLGNHTLLLKIIYNNIYYKVRGLNPHRYKIETNKTYAVYNLSKDKADNCYSETLLTTLYSF